MEAGTRNIINNLLFMLFFPLLAFDVFLFYDDGVGDLVLLGKLWLVNFFLMLLFCFYRHEISLKNITIARLIEVAYSSFAVLFFVVNFFLIGMFTMMIYTRNEFLI